MYGFLPCSNNLFGHLFLVVVYEYLLFQGESYVASAGERIFELLGPGIIGTSAFQVLGCLPESLILLASGLLNSKETAQEYVLTGVGLLAGSTTFLLTVVWGTCVIIGSKEDPYDVNYNRSSIPMTEQCKKFLSLVAGTNNPETYKTARVMLLSVIPFMIILIPNIFGLSYSSGGRVVILITLIVNVAFLLAYFSYQMFEPSIQKQRFDRMKQRHAIRDIGNHIHQLARERLLTEDGELDGSAVQSLYMELDEDGDATPYPLLKKYLSERIKLKKASWGEDKTAVEVLDQVFNCNSDQKITLDDFVNNFTNWLSEARHAKEEAYQHKGENVERSLWSWTKAIMILVLGFAMLGVLAEPLIDSVQNFSTYAAIPPFFVSFVLVPLATNARLTISAIKTCSQRKPKTTASTFSEIYDGVLMNNLFEFPVLLSLIYFRGLSWDFSAEMLIVLLVCAIVGVTASLRTKFPVWMSFIAYLLYPLSLILVYILDDVFKFL